MNIRPFCHYLYRNIIMKKANQFYIFRTISSLPPTNVTSTITSATAGTNVTTFAPDSPRSVGSYIDPLQQDLDREAEFDRMLCGEDSHSVTSDMSRSTGTKTPTSKKRKADETSEILREFLANRPNPSDFMPKKPIDDIQHFLDSIAVTMRRLSPLAIARLKLKIANIVGEEEIAWAQQNPVQYIFLDAETSLATEANQQSTQKLSEQVNAVDDDQMDE